MNKKFSALLILIYCLVISSCSSLEKAHYYKASNANGENYPEISYHPEAAVFRSTHRQYVALTYKRHDRFMRKDNVQEVVIGANYFFNQLATGPVFLPIIPLGTSNKINKQQKLELVVMFGATGPFYKKDEKPHFPEFVVVTRSKGALRPIKVERFNSAIKLTYDTTIEETPEFLIKEDVIHLDNEKLKIPTLKFVFDDSLHYDWFVPIGG